MVLRTHEQLVFRHASEFSTDGKARLCQRDRSQAGTIATFFKATKSQKSRSRKTSHLSITRLLLICETTFQLAH